MKSIYVFIFIVCSVFNTLLANHSITPCEKTYVKPNQILFTESSFYVDIDHIIIYPTSLNVDASGIYFNTISERIHGPWQCKKPGCNTWNEEWREFCKQCGNSR